MAHSSLEMGLNLGMKAAAQAQQRGESEKDRKMRKLMAKEQRDFTEGQAKLQREHSEAMADADRAARSGEAEKQRAFLTEANRIKSELEMARFMTESAQRGDAAKLTAQERAAHAEYRKTSLEGAIAGRAAAAEAHKTAAGVSAAHQKGMLGLAHSAEQRHQEKAYRDSLSPRKIYELEMDDMNTDMDAIDDQLEAFTLTGGPRNPQEARTFKRLTEKRQRLVMAMKIRTDAYAKTGAGAPTGSRVVLVKPDMRTDAGGLLINPGGSLPPETRTTTPIYGNQPLNPVTPRTPRNPVNIPGYTGGTGNTTPLPWPGPGPRPTNQDDEAGIFSQ